MAKTPADRPITQDPQWFASWFDSVYYPKLYAHRDDTEAAGFVDRLIGRLRPTDGAAVLDLGCGAGRHSKYLASQGFRVTGIDLAARSIKAAKRSERPGLRFCRHDMRVPFGTNTFDYVFNFFTSFGYFKEPAEHLTTVRNIADSLKANAGLVLDYLNVRRAELHLTSEEATNVGGIVYRLTRWMDAGHFFKRIVIEDKTRRRARRIQRTSGQVRPPGFPPHVQTLRSEHRAGVRRLSFESLRPRDLAATDRDCHQGCAERSRVNGMS